MGVEVLRRNNNKVLREFHDSIVCNNIRRSDTPLAVEDKVQVPSVPVQQVELVVLSASRGRFGLLRLL
ncbi:hypothetical protein F3Y22_tig00110332pilonHSYRG00592 [Hibiscus syriacus]|uniref:Uncharacterized protein n=1 Tax=Hibiscus syriacus TaxID=106335 RepID=A0A6A3B129_HIBSY|nr:hypothetical protein F3Y22_tig00110332pilonHSYRG00592 [Hibiscus syriacus]